MDCERDFSSIEKVTDPFALIKPTSHNFTWEIDTLSFPGAIQIIPHGIWASDTNDVWMVGHSDDWKARIWHYNGEAWKPITTVGLGVSPTDIIGFNKNDIWFVGHLVGIPEPQKAVQRWDGYQWNEVDTGILNDHCYSIWGTSSTDIYFAYNEGLIAHYDGNNIKKYDTGSGAQMVELFGFNSNDIYACGVKLDNKQPRDSTYYYIYHYNGNKWTLLNFHFLTVHSGYFKFPSSSLWGNFRRILFGTNGLYVSLYLGESNWKPLFKANTSVWFLHGTDINNIFIVGSGGSSIYHFNGSAWNSYDMLKNLDFLGRCVFTIKDKVFIGGINSFDRNAYILRGKRRY